MAGGLHAAAGPLRARLRRRDDPGLFRRAHPAAEQRRGAVPDLENGDPAPQARLFAFFAICALLCALRPAQILGAAMRNPLTMLLIAFAIVSRTWSHAPDITLRRGIALAGTTMCGIWLAGRFRGRELMEILGWAMGISAVLSLLFALLIPELGVHQDGDFVRRVARHLPAEERAGEDDGARHAHLRPPFPARAGARAAQVAGAGVPLRGGRRPLHLDDLDPDPGRAGPAGPASTRASPHAAAGWCPWRWASRCRWPGSRWR